MFTNVPKAIRVLRLKRGWSQEILSGRAGVSREAISRVERGQLRGVTLATVEKITTALGGSIGLQMRWKGEQLDRLIDAAHAALQESVAESMSTLGWLVRAEVSFNHFGDRGRVDILAFHQRLRILIVIEVKTGLGDIQETLGRLDVKARLGGVLAREVGWGEIGVVIPALVIGDSRAARRLVAAHEALFARFNVRGRFALAWIGRPRPPVPSGLLWFVERRHSRQVTSRRARTPSERADSQVT